MNYRNVIDRWLKEKRRSGFSFDDACKAVSLDIKKLNEVLEIGQPEIRSAAIRELKSYIRSEKGSNRTTRKDGKCYVGYSRDLRYRSQLEGAGIIRKLRRPELRELGVDTHTFLWGSVFYEVNESILSNSDKNERRRT